MELISFFVDFVLNIDKHLLEIVQDYRTWTYLILFVIIFMETGFVVTPFLPGDSLLFAAGAIAANPSEPLNLVPLMLLLILAAVLGDNVNYYIGRFFGTKIYDKNYRMIKREYIDRTHLFYEKHGGKTIIIARFMPIIRTFAPFVAGVGTMTFTRFFLFNIVGGILWVILFCMSGFFFGSIPFVKNNFSIVILGIIFVSLLPMIFAFLKNYLDKRKMK
jgi:membrane-associated protein